MFLTLRLKGLNIFMVVFYLIKTEDIFSNAMHDDDEFKYKQNNKTSLRLLHLKP